MLCPYEGPAGRGSRSVITGRMRAGAGDPLGAPDGEGRGISSPAPGAGGRRPDPESSVRGRVVRREENDQYVLDVLSVSQGGTVARRLWFTRRTLEVARQDLFDASGAVQATMVYQNYRAVGSTSAGPLTWPTRVQAEDGLGRAKLVLTFHDVIPNPELTSQDWGSAEVGRDR